MSASYEDVCTKPIRPTTEEEVTKSCRTQAAQLLCSYKYQEASSELLVQGFPI